MAFYYRLLAPAGKRLSHDFDARDEFTVNDTVSQLV